MNITYPHNARQKIDIDFLRVNEVSQWVGLLLGFAVRARRMGHGGVNWANRRDRRDK
jgi:hypothetical protein